MRNDIIHRIHNNPMYYNVTIIIERDLLTDTSRLYYSKFCHIPHAINVSKYRIFGFQDMWDFQIRIV